MNWRFRAGGVFAVAACWPQPWIDSHGTFYSDALRAVERWTIVDANTIDYEATVEDPKVFTQPLRTMRSAMTRALVAAAAFVALAAAPAAGQPVLRTADGRPDLSGIWQAINAAGANILPHHAEPGMPAGLGVVDGNEIPYTPAAAATQRENYANRATLDPVSRCWLPGVPRATYMGFPFQIVQTPNQITMLYEYAHTVRNVFMHSPHLKGPIEWWMGDSRGRWEGDTLVIDVVHFNDQTWFDKAGHHHSEQLHVIERYTPVDRDHLTYEVTIEDPKVFTRAWTMSMPLYRRIDRNMQILEYECAAFDDAFRHGPAEPR